MARCTDRFILSTANYQIYYLSFLFTLFFKEKSMSLVVAYNSVYPPSLPSSLSCETQTYTHTHIPMPIYCLSVRTTHVCARACVKDVRMEIRSHGDCISFRHGDLLTSSSPVSTNRHKPSSKHTQTKYTQLRMLKKRPTLGQSDENVLLK